MRVKTGIRYEPSGLNLSTKWKFHSTLLHNITCSGSVLYWQKIS